MTRRVIWDTSALVTVLKRNENDHKWAVEMLRTLPKPLLLCEAVIAEACFLMDPVKGGKLDVLKRITDGVAEIGFSMIGEVEAVTSLMKKYDDIPMSFADACIVRMSELYPDAAVFTLDSDFLIYRKSRNARIPVIMPGLN